MTIAELLLPESIRNGTTRRVLGACRGSSLRIRSDVGDGDGGSIVMRELVGASSVARRIDGSLGRARPQAS